MRSAAKGTTKNRGQKDSLDRFYTDIDEAYRLFDILINTLPEYKDDAIFVEPSAGDGAFVLAMEKTGIPEEHIVALDLLPADHPQCASTIHQHDFLLDDFEDKMSSLNIKAFDEFPLIFVGNPPFGEQCKLAIEFVNHSLEFGQYCAFILPMSFYKETIQKKLSGKVTDIIPVENIDYRVGAERIAVPSAFFIIDGKQNFTPLPDKSGFLPFYKIPTTKRAEADFAIRRVGGTAGNATDKELANLSSETYYFYKRDADCPDDIIDIINSCEFPERDWSVGPRSLSSKEIAKNVYQKLVEMGMIDAAD